MSTGCETLRSTSTGRKDNTMEQLEVIKITEDAKSLIILDQTQLPNHEEYLTLQTKEEMWKAIKLLQVRGAPAIGVFAGYAMAVLAQHYPYDSYDAFKKAFDQDADYLNTSRPTAVNLSWALNRMKAFVEASCMTVYRYSNAYFTFL